MTDVSSSSMVIRRATKHDNALLSTLAARLTDFELPAWRRPEEIATADGREMVRSVQRGDSDDEVFIAERGGVAVGCLHMLTATDFFGRRHAHVSVISTTREAEGSGVGQALMSHAEEWAKRRGLTLLTLNVFWANDRARRFYERGGFSPEFVKYAKLL
jgi:GNAT superfamily N-acetyltransferase